MDQSIQQSSDRQRVGAAPVGVRPGTWFLGIALVAGALSALFIASAATGQTVYFIGLALFLACVLGVFALIAFAYDPSPSPLSGADPLPADGPESWAAGDQFAGHHEPATDSEDAAAHHAEEGQHHPISVYLKVWGWLFVLSVLSYMVELADLQGYLRWSLILLFMILKAGLIVAIFMHVLWERLALTYAILLPPLAILVFVWLMVYEGDYTAWTRIFYLGEGV
jgi:cytochrome c oxidase subunit IV